MKKILVLGGHSAIPTDTRERQAFAQGLRALLGDDVAVSDTALDTLQFVLAPNQFDVYDGASGTNLALYDAYILRNKMRTHHNIAYALSRFCAAQHKPFFNDYSHYFPGTKLAQAVVFYEQRVPFLKTVYALDPTAFQAGVMQHLAMPLVLKDARGAKGESNYLVRDPAALADHLSREPGTDFLAQEFCANDRDYRLLLAGTEQLVIKRQSAGDTHLNNTSKGGTASIALQEVPASVVAQARQLAHALHLHIAGVDVMPRLGTSDFYFLEINSQPQLFTGSMPDEKAAMLLPAFRALLGLE